MTGKAAVGGWEDGSWAAAAGAQVGMFAIGAGMAAWFGCALHITAPKNSTRHLAK